MWTLRRGHRHLGPDTLAEYMDGRLGAAARARVDQELASCADCREELEELQDTVSLLRQLPVEPVPRSFTMPAPPVQPDSPREFAPLRMPRWVYAGAASAAAVVLAVLVSADATGLLEPGTPQEAREIAVEAEMAPASLDQATANQKAARVPAATMEVEQEDSLQAAAAVPPETVAEAAPQSAMAQTMPSPMPAVRSGQDVEAAIAAPPTADSSVPVPSEANQFTADATGLPEPGTLQVPPEFTVEAEMALASRDQATSIQHAGQVPAVTVEVEREVSPQAAAAASQETAAQAAPESATPQGIPSPMPAVKQGRTGEAAKAPPPTAVSSLPESSEANLTTVEPGLVLTPATKTGGTATVWRVLEGIAAALGLVFLGGLLLRRRSQRGARPG